MDLMNAVIRVLADHDTVAELVIGAAGFVLSMAVIDVIGRVSARRLFRKRGYRVRYKRAGEYMYEEAVPDSPSDTRLLPFLGRTVEGRVVPVLPLEAQWDSEVPPWARGRRQEIANRISGVFNKPPLNADAR